MNRFRALPFTAIVGMLCASGCGSPALLQVETSIRPDGSCDRSIWQPKDELLPDGAMSPEWRARWRTVSDVKVPPAFAAENPNPDRAYFHAEGSFPRPADIPAHFLKRIDGHPEIGASELVRSCEREDYGLIVVHRWRETITNIVTRDGFLKARDQFIDLGVPMFRQALEEVFGREYDVKTLADEVAGRARPFLDEVLDIYYDWMVHPKVDPATLWPRFVAALRRAGVELPEGVEKQGDQETVGRAIQEYLRTMILRDVKRRDGKPTTEADAQAILNSQSSPPFNEGWANYAKDHKDELDAKLLPLVARMTGLYNFPPIFAGPGPQFVFGLRLPGWVVETNGTEDKGRIVWSFNGGDLFPGGFEMKAESLDVDRPAQARLLGRVVIDDANSARALRDLFAKDDALADLLRRAAKKGDPAILRDFEAKDEPQRARLDALKELLQLSR